jgi:O-antigen ligase
MLIGVGYCILVLGLAVLSSFRSRIYFATASMASVFWCYGYRRRLFLGIAIAFFLVIPVLTIMPKQMVPVAARRALSTLLPYDRADISAMHERGMAASGETGWSSSFRSALLEAGLRSIRKQPLLGSGWSFSADELMLAASMRGVKWGASGLVTAGDYHNSLMTIAVKCGLPAAFAMMFGLLLLLWNAGMRQVDDTDDADFRVLYAGLMGAVVTIFGQMLMNGGGQDLQAICAILGFFHGVQYRFDPEASEGDVDAAT